MEESYSTTKPPFFDGLNYLYWKIQMITFLQSMDLLVWMFIQTKWTKPTNLEGEWTKTHRKAYLANYKALNAIFCVLSPIEFRHIYNLITAKDVWELLQVTHERTSAVKKSKL